MTDTNTPETADQKIQQRLPVAQTERRSTFDLPDVNLVQNNPFMSSHAFAHAHRMATVLSNTSMVPDAYRQSYWDKDKNGWVDNPNAVGNCMIALDLSNRLGTGVLEVMQNVDVIYGRPAMRALLTTALINKHCGPGKPYQHELRYESNGKTGDDYGVRAYTIAADGTRLDGPWITWKLVKAEGWNSRKGNKWNTIPDKMFHKRAASWWADLHAPHITLGLMDPDEVQDAFPEDAPPTRAQVLEQRLSQAALAAPDPDAETGDAQAQDGAEPTTPADKPKPRGTRRAVRQKQADKPADDAGEKAAEDEAAAAREKARPEVAAQKAEQAAQQQDEAEESKPPPQPARPALNLE